MLSNYLHEKWLNESRKAFKTQITSSRQTSLFDEFLNLLIFWNQMVKDFDLSENLIEVQSDPYIIPSTLLETW